MKTTFSKAFRGGYEAETMTETDANGHAWQIRTYKGSNGFVTCSAIQGTDSGNGMFSYEMFGGKRLELAKEATKGTEAAAKRVHAAGLEAFAKIQAEAPPAYVVGVGQIIFTDSMGNWEDSKRVIYEVVRAGNFKTVTLDGKQLRHDDHVKPYSEKFGIGTYYNEGETLPLEEVNDLVNQARQATEEREQAEQKANEEAARERARKIEEGKKIISAIPEGVQAVIVAEHRNNTSDPQSDYHGHETTETIYLAFSTHTRDIFSELRKAAGNFEHTKQYATEPEPTYWNNGGVKMKNTPPDEHREKYSMGEGYYLGDSKYSGWIVSKSNIDGRSLEALQIAAAEGRFFCDAQPETTKEAPKFEAQEVKAGTVQIIDYSEKAIAVIGDTKPIKDLLKSLGGKFNFRLSCGSGWIFPKSRLEQVQKALSKKPEPPTEPEPTTPAPVDTYTLRDEAGETLATGTEGEIVDTLNTIYHYDQKDNEAEPFTSIEEAKEAATNDGLTIAPDPETIEPEPSEDEAQAIEAEEFDHDPIEDREPAKIAVPQVAADWSPHGNQAFFRENGATTAAEQKAGRVNTSLPAPQMFLQF